MFPRLFLRALLALPYLTALSACTQSAPDVLPAVATAASTPAQQHGGGPDDDAIELPPDGWHGNWRLVTADDPHDQALMALTIQSSAGQAAGSGDYVLFQPFCDAVAAAPISGTADCELIGQGAAVERVDTAPDRIVLAFRPTADGGEHRLELRRDGDRLVGDYVLGAGDLRRAVSASRAPGEPP